MLEGPLEGSTKSFSPGGSGRPARTHGVRRFIWFLLAFALIATVACSSPPPSVPESSPSTPTPPLSVLQRIEACLDSRGNHPVLEQYAYSLIEGSDIEIDRTLHGIGDPDKDGEVQLTMVFSHPRRKAMRILGRLQFDTCEVEIIYPPQQGTPYDQCQYLSEQGDYGRCQLNAEGACTCSPE